MQTLYIYLCALYGTPLLRGPNGFFLLGRLSTRCWNTAVRICFQTRASVRSGTDFRRWGLARSRCCNSSQRCSVEFRSGLRPGQQGFSSPESVNHFFMDVQGPYNAEKISELFKNTQFTSMSYFWPRSVDERCLLVPQKQQSSIQGDFLCH